MCPPRSPSRTRMHRSTCPSWSRTTRQRCRTLRHAGSLFLGGYSPEAAGDYATGSNHVLPTAGLARAYGALSVETFGRWMQVQRLTKAGLASIRDSVAVVADAEGLSAHRRAVDIRFDDEATTQPSPEDRR